MDEKESNTKNKVKYLYGAAVQGIQEFIFQTNKLKEIVGASELVEKICTSALEELIEEICQPQKFEEGKHGETIVKAAGNIKHIFPEKSLCEAVVKNFPRKLMNMAPGITISQAVVTLAANEGDYEAQSNKLETLLRAQRNKASRSMSLGLMAVSRAPSTGLPAVEVQDGELIDAASSEKLKHSTAKDLIEKSIGTIEKGKKIAYNIDDITDTNNWIAVIHADGNGMGNIFQNIGRKKENMKKVSPAVSRITEYAAKQAFNTVKESFSGKKAIPVRPVVLGGDDVTLICRADFALAYAKALLEQFEAASKGKQIEVASERTKIEAAFEGTQAASEVKKLGLKNLGLEFNNENEKDNSLKADIEKGLTACAGIVFVKASYPFHYAAHLAESLCVRAKKAAKGLEDPNGKEDAEKLPPSCLMFYKVQDSFVEDFDEIVNRKLTPQSFLTFENGPYYCGERATATAFGNQCSNTVEKLMKDVESLRNDKEAKGLKANLRQWIDLVINNVGFADQKMKRIRNVSSFAKTFVGESFESLSNKNNAANNKNPIRIPFYDMLTLSSINVTTKQPK